MLARERENGRLRTEAALIYQAITAVLSKNGAKQFKDTMKKME